MLSYAPITEFLFRSNKALKGKETRRRYAAPKSNGLILGFTGLVLFIFMVYVADEILFQVVLMAREL
jgi:hypothetical protein